MDLSEVGVGSGLGVGKEQVDVAAFVFEARFDKSVPERIGSLKELVEGSVVAVFRGDIADLVRLFELAEKGWDFFDVTGVGDLAEVIGGADDLSEDTGFVVFEFNRAEVGVRSGAADDGANGADAGGVPIEIGQVSGRDVAAPQFVAVGVLGAGTIGVVGVLHVADVVEKGSDEAVLKLVRVNRGLLVGKFPIEADLSEAEGGLEGVLEVVVGGVDRLPTSKAFLEQMDDVGEDLALESAFRCRSEHLLFDFNESSFNSRHVCSLNSAEKGVR